MKKKLFLGLCVSILLIINSIGVFAAEETNPVNAKQTDITTTLTITDPDTGEVWEWDIPVELYVKSNKFRASDGNVVSTVMVNADIGEYLYQTLGYPSQVSTLNDDITLQAGLTYSFSGNDVAIYSAFGSTTPKGLYYAENRKFNWRNPGSGGGGSYSPTSNSWSYPGDGVYGGYYSSLPPKAILDCKIRVSGMSSYRNVSVTCSL